FARTSKAQSSISFGCIRSAAHAPNPPARITAIEDDGGQAPASGERRIGTQIPNRPQKPAARLRGSSMSTPSSRFQFEIHLCAYLQFCLLTLDPDDPCSLRVWANVLPYG